MAETEKDASSRELERSLVEAAQSGDRAAFEELVEIHRERLYCAALAIVRNHDDARDLSQDAFVKAFKNLHRFQSHRPFYPWIYRILRNACLDYLQKHGPRRKVSFDQLIEDQHVQFAESESRQSSPEGMRGNIQSEQVSNILRHEIGQLKPEFREIIMMNHFDDLSYKEIAGILQIPIGTVMSRLYHARKALAKALQSKKQDL